jgi:hypothetical protein
LATFFVFRWRSRFGSRPRRLSAIGLALTVLLTLGADDAFASFEIASVSCPSTADPGTVPVIDVEVQSLTSGSVDVRLSAGFSGSGDSTLFGRSLIGPLPAAPVQQLSFFERRTVALAAAPPLPISPIGDVVEYFVLAQGRVSGDETVDTRACLIEVPEPGFATSLFAALPGLFLAASRRRRRGRCRA